MIRSSVGWLVAAGVLLPATGLGVAHVEFYFTQAGSSTPITNLTIGGIGSTFNLTVWYNIVDTTFPNSAVDAFVGFDTSNSYGLGAAPLDNKLGLNGTTTTAFSNYNANYPTRFALFGGGYTKEGQASNSIRPYGTDVSLAANAGTEYSPTGAVPLFDISLKNLALGAGQSYNVVVWDAWGGVTDPNAFPAFDSTTYLLNLQNQVMRPGSFAGTVTVSVPVPEPASIVALAIGAAALIRRRRR